MKISIEFEIEDEVVERLADLNAQPKEITEKMLKMFYQKWADNATDVIKNFVEMYTTAPEGVSPEEIGANFLIYCLRKAEEIGEDAMNEIEEES